jgi:hypothetical protein
MKRIFIVQTSIAVWFVTAANEREAMLKVLFWSDRTEAALRCEAL